MARPVAGQKELVSDDEQSYVDRTHRLKDPGTGSMVPKLTIITTKPDGLTATVHNRMPVILHPDDYEEWLMKVDREDPPVALIASIPGCRCTKA
jgi:putative SOS response-associated peptidase YedK